MHRNRNSIPKLLLLAAISVAPALAAFPAHAELEPLPDSSVLGQVVGVATDAGSGRLWALGSAGRLHEFDLETGEETRSVVLGGSGLRGPQVRAGGDRLVLADETSQEVILVDTATLAVVHVTPLPCQGSHLRATFHPDGRTVRAWGAGGGIGDRIVLDAETGAILAHGRIFYGSPDDVDVVSPDGRVIFTTEITPFGESRFVDTHSGAVLANVAIEAPARPAFSPTADTAWLTDLGARTVRKVDLDSGDVSVLEEDIRATAVALDDELGVVVVAALHRVSLFDRDTNALLGEVTSLGNTRLDQYGTPPIALVPGSGTAMVLRDTLDRLDVIDIDPASPTFATVIESKTFDGCNGGGGCDAGGILLSRDGARVAVPLTSRSAVARYALPQPNVTVLLIPDPDTIVVSPGERFRFDVVVTNRTGSAQPVVGRIDVTLPNGNPFPGNPVAGPKSVTLGAERSVRKQLSIPVRAGAAPGAYRVRAELELALGEHSTNEIVFFVDS